MKKPIVIGVVPSFDDGTVIPGGQIDRVFLRREYTMTLSSVGAVPLILNPDMPVQHIIDVCDGVVISGGEDIDPRHYGQSDMTDHLKEPAERFEWESELIETCDTVGIPILGICYGMQRLNVHYGGTLIQDIETQIPHSVSHDKTMHDIQIERDFLGMKRGEMHKINSRHHQAIDRLADGFVVCAVASDGLTEAVEGRGHYGMQWHPESDTTGMEVYRSFVGHCAKLAMSPVTKVS